MKKLTTINFGLFILLTLFFALSFSACSDVVSPDGANNKFLTNEVDQTSNFMDGLHAPLSAGSSCNFNGESTLKAGRNSIESGIVQFDLVGETLTVNYVAKDGWAISETHLWVGTDLNDMPSNGNGSPRNGHFPYTDSFFSSTNNCIL